MALFAILLAACTGKKAREEAARALEAAEIERIDSVTTELSTIKNGIDSSVMMVDELVSDL